MLIRDAFPRGWGSLLPAAEAGVELCVDDTEPYVICDDVATGRAFLFRKPRAILVAWFLRDLHSLLAKLRYAVAAGRYVAGYLAYDCAPAFEAGVGAIEHNNGKPLAWFGIFDHCETLTDLASQLPAKTIVPLQLIPMASKARYVTQLRRALSYIQNGDAYQINYTFPARLSSRVDAHSLYGSLRRRQLAGWGAMVSHGSRQLLSFSPELFFAIRAGKLIARPMKGTRPRRISLEGDARAHTLLNTSPKNRA